MATNKQDGGARTVKKAMKDDNTGPSKRSIQLTVALPRPLFFRLNDYCKKRGMNQQDILRLGLDKFLAENNF